MNSDMIGGIIRAIGAPVLAYLVGKGTIPAGDYAPILASLGALLTAVWSISTNRSGTVIK